ncbi:hypothetical protein DPMN_034512 [Dreissena polymorpha]|uniref:Uncharacterized protein n=1 Tax=Dreissena polymorpha TaxID=45954 RepID=A0A9D4M7T5_DREPO|nr:hypothetical protein DPMN_034512 [Dreissena polymorpha]
MPVEPQPENANADTAPNTRTFALRNQLVAETQSALSGRVFSTTFQKHMGQQTTIVHADLVATEMLQQEQPSTMTTSSQLIINADEIV